MSLRICQVAKQNYTLGRRQRGALFAPFQTTTTRNAGFFFLVPENPKDTPDTNALMRVEQQVPAYNEISPKKLQTGFQKLHVLHDTAVDHLLTQLKTDKTTPKTFENVFMPIEAALWPLDFAYKTARHFSFIYPYSSYHTGFSRIEKTLSRSRNEKWSNRDFYAALRELESDKHLLSPSRRRMLERCIRNCTLNGLNLTVADYAKFQALSDKITEKQDNFKERLSYATKKSGVRIAERMPMDEVPIGVKKLIARDPMNPNKGPWHVYPNEFVFEILMKYTSNRELRKALFDAYYSRASILKDNNDTNNSALIKDIVRYRKEQANVFGYKNYADMIIENKAATSVDNVIDLFEKIRTSIRPAIDDDLIKLQKYSATHGNLTPLESYDIDYWKQKHTTQYYSIDPARVMQYFPFQKVLNGLFDIAKSFFNVELRRDDGHKQKLWDPKVLVYQCYDGDAHRGTLLIDPYLRPHKIDNIWSYAGRESSTSMGVKPLVYLNMNVRDLSESTANVLTFEQVKQLFVEFGKAMQSLLAQTEFIDFSDRNTIETDASNLTANLFRRLVYQPEVIAMVSAHLQTGEPMPIEMLKQLKNADSNFRRFNLMKHTMMSAFDIECHISNEFWSDVMEKLWSRYMPNKMVQSDHRPCQFTHIFGENFGCAYYSLLWSEMLAADLFEAFNEVGFDNKTRLSQLGRKYMEIFMTNGSSVEANELFRQFRGRNPSMDPFIKSYMPTKKSN